jgi:hypothetical protein
MTEDEQQLLKVGAESAIKPFANLIERLFGGPADQMGGMLEDGLKVRRMLRQIKLYRKLQKKIEDAGFDPRQIPDTIWVPSLQLASLEDDEDLQEIWANLLANAADPRADNPVTASFPVILKELTAREVKFLDTLYERTRSQPRAGAPVTEKQLTNEELLNVYSEAGLSRQPRLAYLTWGDWDKNGMELQADLDDFALMMDLLKRNRLLDEAVYTEPINVRNIMNSMGPNLSNMPSEVTIETKTTYSFTQLGASFVSACRPPDKSDKDSEGV